MELSSYRPILEITRGSIVESVHFGSMAVVDNQRQLVAAWGDVSTPIYMRSAAKPFQALAFFERGGRDYFNLDSHEIALMCSSHSGTDAHVAAIKRLQEKTGIDETCLLCGSHIPFHQPTYHAMLLRGEIPTPIRHNCSGKHSGMLAHARMRNLPIEDYIAADHPVQRTILETFSEMCELQSDQVVVGTDGCSVPTFAVPLKNAALAYMKLVSRSGLDEKRAEACRLITDAMSHHGDMVAGPGRIDTVVMSLLEGRVVAKIGAEGYHGLAVFPDAIRRGSPALGIVYKVSDGDLGGRAQPLIVIEILRQLGLLTSAMMEKLAESFNPHIYNQRHIHVGAIRPCFSLGLSL